MTPTSEQATAQTAGLFDRMEQGELAIVRRAYAKHVLANAGVDDARVEAAFAAVRREHFLGPRPWQMPRWSRPYYRRRAMTRFISIRTRWSASYRSAT